MSASSELCFMSAVAQRQLLDAGEISALQLLDAHIDRIERHDGVLNAVVTRCFEEAREVAATRPLHGPLAGLPIAHKDLVPTQGLRTTYGSLLHVDNVPTEDALVVARIKAAGAVTIGKTNTPEFGAGSQTFNRVFGATRNPYDVSRTCGGSSGGAAVALAARFLPIADGSDTGGSLRNPAAFCNVVGFRPSPGRVPTESAGSAVSDLSTPGPMARSVDDAALLFSVIAGPHDRSAGVLTEPGETFRRVTPAQLRNLRVALTEDFGGLPVQPEVRKVVRAVAAKMEAAGARVVQACPDLKDATRIFHVLRAARFRARFGDLPEDERAELKDTIIWNTEAGEALTPADEDWAVLARSALVARVAEFFQHVDVLSGADHAGAPVRCGDRVGEGDRGPTHAHLHRVDAELQLDYRHLLSRPVATRRVRVGLARWRAARGAHAARRIPVVGGEGGGGCHRLRPDSAGPGLRPGT